MQKSHNRALCFLLDLRAIFELHLAIIKLRFTSQELNDPGHGTKFLEPGETGSKALYIAKSLQAHWSKLVKPFVSCRHIGPKFLGTTMFYLGLEARKY